MESYVYHSSNPVTSLGNFIFYWLWQRVAHIVLLLDFVVTEFYSNAELLIGMQLAQFSADCSAS